MIYFFQGEQTRRVKIGFTTRFIHSRIRTLQTGSPDKLTFIGAHPGNERLESRLHHIFGECHSHGEWFNESPKLIRYIKNYCIHDMEIAHSVDSLVSEGQDYKFLLTLDYESIHHLYMSSLVKKLEQRRPLPNGLDQYSF